MTEFPNESADSIDEAAMAHLICVADGQPVELP